MSKLRGHTPPLYLSSCDPAYSRLSVQLFPPFCVRLLHVAPGYSNGPLSSLFADDLSDDSPDSHNTEALEDSDDYDSWFDELKPRKKRGEECSSDEETDSEGVVDGAQRVGEDEEEGEENLSYDDDDEDDDDEDEDEDGVDDDEDDDEDEDEGDDEDDDVDDEEW